MVYQAKNKVGGNKNNSSNIDQESLTAFLYVFTKYPENKFRNKGYVTILAGITKRTKKAYAPDILNDSPNTLLEELADLDKFIEHPEEVFRPFASKVSNSAVHAQVQEHKENIENALQYKLDKLKKLNLILENADIENKYNDCVIKLTEEWNKKCKRAQLKFNTSIISSRSICIDDVLAYQNVIHEVTSLKEFIIEVQMEKDMIALQHLWTKSHKYRNASMTLLLLTLMFIKSCKQGVKYVDEAKEFVKRDQFAKFRKGVEKIGTMVPLEEHLQSFINSLNKPNTVLDYNRLYEFSLTSHSQELQQFSEELELDLDHRNQLEEARKVIMHLEKLRRLEKIIPELAHLHQEIVSIGTAYSRYIGYHSYEFALKKKSANEQEEIKHNLTQLKRYADDVRRAISYLHEMGFEKIATCKSKFKRKCKCKYSRLQKKTAIPKWHYMKRIDFPMKNKDLNLIFFLKNIY
ncbi:hypothetical protein RFI_29267 [Reticulomyxa filosa]|uniref:Uncharacterized protein n=1 Tax=Reticulomyxa filosa TaxID=46433 RepID=X6M3S6_RETFI|nr:hypothetical protein RFI_29267 [Reticulomyxa filosa]|eukprot:ETO08122.1 hypothetical protein RFI_29267 [Reticulomyxa filosa]